jgi:hypothetical protein
MKDSSSDFGIDLGFRTAVINSVEQENLAMFERRTRRTRTVPMPRPILGILQQFVHEKIDAVVKKDSTEALRGAAELREVLRSLVHGLKHPEFKPDLERLVAQMNRIGRACLERLVIRSISVTRPEEIEECRQLLNELAEAGHLTEAEFEAIVDEHLAELAAKKAS